MTDTLVFLLVFQCLTLKTYDGYSSRVQGKYYYSHFSDAFRICVLWRYGGNYIDTDVLVLHDLSAVRNSFGVEEVLRSPNPSWWDNIRGVTEVPLDHVYNVNLAISSFDVHAPFLAFMMLSLMESYDPDCWNCAGPALAKYCIARWQQFHPDLVELRPDPSVPGSSPRFAGSVTLFTDPGVYYPVSWQLARAATRAEDFDGALLEIIRGLPSLTYHVYTQMFKLTNTTFQYDSDSLLGKLLE